MNALQLTAVGGRITDVFRVACKAAQHFFKGLVNASHEIKDPDYSCKYGHYLDIHIGVKWFKEVIRFVIVWY